MKFLMYTYVQESVESIMAGSTYGTFLSVTTWGESHGKGIGVVLDGCPAGLPLTEQDIQIYLNRRKPGQSRIAVVRKQRQGVVSVKQPRHLEHMGRCDGRRHKIRHFLSVH